MLITLHFPLHLLLQAEVGKYITQVSVMSVYVSWGCLEFTFSSLVKMDQPILKAKEQTYRDPLSQECRQGLKIGVPKITFHTYPISNTKLIVRILIQILIPFQLRQSYFHNQWEFCLIREGTSAETLLFFSWQQFCFLRTALLQYCIFEFLCIYYY